MLRVLFSLGVLALAAAIICCYCCAAQFGLVSKKPLRGVRDILLFRCLAGGGLLLLFLGGSRSRASS